MAQDTGHWSVRRPRETLGGLNVNSSIPQPPSAMKRSNSSAGGGGGQAPFSAGHARSLSGSRQSLAPTRPSQPLFQRASSTGAGANNPADAGLASVKRSSLRPYSTPGVPGRASTDSDRRSSVFRGGAGIGGGGRQSTVMSGLGGITSMGGGMGGGMGSGGHHQSFFSQAPAPAGALRDPRPLKDRSYLGRIGQELVEYMTQHNFELEMSHTLSQNVVKSPTQKDFVYMFQWLYRRIDPNYRFQRSIDQEVPVLLKQLRYPYEKGITKSQIAAVGGQNWGTFLGLLHWMMELAVMLERYTANRYDDACAEAGLDVVADHITFEFLAHAYQDWLVMDVEDDENGGGGGEDAEAEQLAKMLAPHIDVMTRQLDQAYAKHEEELAILEAEHAKLLRDIEELEKSTPDLAVLDDHFKIMEEDKVKFEEYNELALQRCDKYEKRIPLLQEELDKLQEEVKEAETEQRGLRQAVDDQGISMADIDRMTSERERLQKGIEAAGQRLEEAKRKVAERELDAGRRLDELERTVDRYNTLAYQIGLMPPTAANAKGRDYELRVNVNDGPSFGASAQQQPSSSSSSSSAAPNESGTNPPAANMENERLLVDPTTGYQPAHILNLDLRGHVKNSFLALRKEVAERRSAALEAMMKDHDLLDSIKEAMEDKRGEVEALEHRVRAAEQEHEKTKEVTTAQRLASDAQIEKMEKELAKMRANLSESVQLMEQREMNTNIEYEQLTLRASALREELHTEIMRMLNDVIKFKMHVQKSLEEYEEFVTEELVKELGDEEAKGEAGGSAEAKESLYSEAILAKLLPRTRHDVRGKSVLCPRSWPLRTAAALISLGSLSISPAAFMNTVRPLSRLRALRSAFLFPTTTAPSVSASPAAVRLLATMATTTDTSTYKLNHTMIRVKDPKESVKFYEFLGMKQIRHLQFPDNKFDLYFLAYDTPGKAVSAGNKVFDREGVLELTHNYGTESDPNFTVNNGNKEPHRGFGHTCISVDNIQAACQRIEDAGYKFQKKLTDGRMRNIAFALDPDGYWVEVIGQKPLEATEHETTTDVTTYRMNHTMIRVKDPEKSLKFYQDVLGLSLLRTSPNEAAKFTNFFLGYKGDYGADTNQADREGVLELCWNYGTEKDESFSYHDGNKEPQGFGHICVAVDNIDAACQRFEDLGVNWKKRLTDGRMKNVAFVLDPDGYWVEIVQNERLAGKDNF